MRNNLTLYRTILNCMKEGVIVIATESRDIIECNVAFLQLWGIDPELYLSKKNQELLEKILDNLVDPASFLQESDRIFSGLESSTLDILELKDKRFIERRSEPFYLDSKLIGRIFVFKDITEQMISTQNLITQKALLETILSSIPYSIFWKDKNLNYLGCNMRFAHDAGKISPAQVIGKTDYDMPWTLEESNFFRECDKDILKTGIGFDNKEETQNRADGLETTLLTSKVPLRDEQKNVVGILGVYTDITEFKQNQQLVKAQELKLVSASQLSALGEMAAGIAHEINNPLSIIKVSIKYIRNQLMKETLNKERISEALLEVDETVTRIAQIILGLRNISRNSGEDKEVVAYKEILDDVLGIASERFRFHNVEIRKSINDELLSRKFLANRIQTSQVIINLLNNSFDALLAAGKETKWIEISIKENQDALSLSITDSGLGIPPAIRDKMFSPFFTTKPIGKGTGIGLSISKSMVENNGGEFFYDDTSANTKFVIRFPKLKDVA